MRIRLIKAVKVVPIMSLENADTGSGSPVTKFEPGEYNVGTEIPWPLACTALESGDAIAIPEAGERETKLA